MSFITNSKSITKKNEFCQISLCFELNNFQTNVNNAINYLQTYTSLLKNIQFFVIFIKISATL